MMFIKMYFSLIILSLFFNFILCEIYYVSLSVKPEDPAIQITDQKFLSVALDTAAVANHFHRFEMINKRLHVLIKNISPGYFRIGGNMADRLHFSENATKFENYDFRFASYLEECAYEELQNCSNNIPEFTMSGYEWTEINNFAKSVQTKILFDLNCLIRNKDGSWNSTNAEELISFSNDRKFNIDWQLGNEPNAFKHLFNNTVNATQLAKDFIVLRSILNKFPRYKHSILVGPDVTRPRPQHRASQKYLKKFLKGINKENILNAISFHQYYLNGRIASKSDFLNPTTFSLLEQQINTVNKIVADSSLHKLPVWLTETSSAYGGGAPGLSDRFVGSFLWLDKLGLSAKMGVKVVIRQSIKRDHYALIDENYDPNPDWWLNILYNKFVGSQVLNCNITAPETVRLYCQCSPASKTPSITIFGINISNSTAHIQVEGLKETYEPGSAYILVSEYSMLTKKVFLNGDLLEVSKDNLMPRFHPKSVEINKPLVMPSYSLAFWVLPASNAKPCFQHK